MDRTAMSAEDPPLSNSLRMACGIGENERLAAAIIWTPKVYWYRWLLAVGSSVGFEEIQRSFGCEAGLRDEEMCSSTDFSAGEGDF